MYTSKIYVLVQKLDLLPEFTSNSVAASFCSADEVGLLANTTGAASAPNQQYWHLPTGKMAWPNNYGYCRFLHCLLGISGIPLTLL